jgi:hypothetical protein
MPDFTTNRETCSSGFPRIFAMRIVLPFDKVLVTSLSLLRFQNLFNRECDKVLHFQTCDSFNFILRTCISKHIPKRVTSHVNRVGRKMARPFKFLVTFSEDLKFPHRISDSKRVRDNLAYMACGLSRNFELCQLQERARGPAPYYLPFIRDPVVLHVRATGADPCCPEAVVCPAF